MFRRLTFLFLLASLLCNSAHAQSHDFQTWTGLQLNFEKIKRLRIIASAQMRRENNALDLRQLWGELEAVGKVNKYFTVSLGSRYVFAPGNPNLRVYSDLTGSYAFKLKNDRAQERDSTLKGHTYYLDFSLRLRLQQEFDFSSGSDIDIRPRLKVAFYRKKWEVRPWVSAEEYFSRIPGGFLESKLRFFAGADIDLPKDFELSVYYIWQKQLNKANPLQANVIAVNLIYTWD